MTTYTTLISAPDLQALIASGAPLMVFDCSFELMQPTAGAQQYAHALFFMTEQALADFRRSTGWAAGAEIRYATPESGAAIGKETTETAPVIGLIFGQQGLIAGATLAGVKYTRIIP